MDHVTQLRHFDFPADDPVSLNDFAVSDIYTVRQVAARLGIGAGLAYELIREGEIPAKRLGRRWVVPRELFHAWLNEMPKGA
ncbi:MAG TPA: helix-turn-helix domain-containing protein [Pseudonocardiaceae bacterium]|jgi:excisionase family DNA binding protein|nr:helix-turn-helix domain-containing protein [Pseudonocardiaceae bacterium]